MHKIISISGFGQAADFLQWVVPETEYLALDYAAHSHKEAFFAEVAKKPIHAEVLIGWSLGGSLAVELLANRIITADRLVLLAAPFRFVRGPQEEAAFEAFAADVTANPETALKHFMLLISHGDSDMRQVLRGIHLHSNLAVLPYWLAQLKAFDGETMDYSGFPPVTLIYGEKDKVVASDQAELFQQKLPHAKITLLPECAHAPHLHAPKLVRAALL